MGPVSRLHTCACCGYRTIASTWDICRVCEWQSDPVQEAYPDTDVGANTGLTLRQAQRNFVSCGTVPHCAESVRMPEGTYERDPEWKALSPEQDGLFKEEQFTDHRLAGENGEEATITVRETPDRRFVCPVCGYLLQNPPYYCAAESKEGPMRDAAHMHSCGGRQRAVPSGEACPSCCTQFGGSNSSLTVNRSWHERCKQLRDHWIAEKVRAKDQVQQLKNLDIYLDGHVGWQPCACCGYRTVTPKYSICSICRWTNEYPPKLDDRLRQAQQSFLNLGVCDEKLIGQGRRPTEQEKPGTGN